MSDNAASADSQPALEPPEGNNAPPKNSTDGREQPMNHILKKAVLPVLLLAGLGATAYATRDRWLPHRNLQETADQQTAAESGESTSSLATVLLSDQAIANLKLSAAPVRPATFWKSIQVPGMVVDRPGRSDRGIVSPLAGLVTRINFFPGDTVREGEALFTVRILSESLHQTQSELFKAIQDIKLAEAQKKRLTAAGDAIAQSRIIEIENQIIRLEVAVKANRRDLQNRGLTPEQIDAVIEGKFISEIVIKVPENTAKLQPLTPPTIIKTSAGEVEQPAATFEVQENKVELGQKVDAGQTLCLLANHQILAIEGQAFRDETPLLERSVKEGWPVEVDFQEDAGSGWPPLEQSFRIQHLANTINPDTRTFAFLMRLDNQSRVVEQDGVTQMLWRFRPGQKVRLQIRVEKFENVFVLPAEAIAREGADVYVFTQNVNTFERKPVRLILQDRRHAVIANDGSLIPGAFVVQRAAAQLNRMARTSSSSVPKGYHIHADGSLHKNEDEGK